MFFKSLLPKKIALLWMVRIKILAVALGFILISNLAQAKNEFLTRDNFGETNEVVESYSEVPYKTPENAQADVNPRSMVVMSNDHQLFFKAYTDWNDVDNDGDIDATFNEDIEYYGYFDSNACYVYDEDLSGGAFKYNGDTKAGHACPGNKEWNGNFLNWVSMTRMDIVRKVLYGGKRFRDNDSQSTVLERAYLPYDAHSFVKVVTDKALINRFTPFNGSNSVSFCNTTGYGSTGQSKDVDQPPLIRVAEGEWRNWAANERWQCTWRNELERKEGDASKRPNKADNRLGQEFHARVEVCTRFEEGCKNYPDSNYPKPTGLLHEYADSIDFGLLTGSYKENTRGGVLRSNIRSFNEELNSSTGIFKDTSGIVSNIDAFRISRYRYSDGTYDSDGCSFGTRLSQVGGGTCSSWGNPLAEMVEETLNYLSGGNRTSSYSVGTGNVELDYVTGLSSPEWDSQSEHAWCAAHSMILVNSSETSFDSDDLGNITLRGGGTVKSWTNKVAQEEGIGGDYFVGQSGGNIDKLCTAKTIGSGSFGSIKGICPGAPGLEGSYNVAGLAKYAHDTRIIRSKDDSQGSNVDTFAVRLTTNTPIIDLGQVKIVPACENIDDHSKCAIVDFRPKSITDNSGEFEVTWEVAEFGGDYDSDIETTFKYVLSGSRLTLTTNVKSQSSTRRTGIGYILSGTSGRYKAGESNELATQISDGFTVHSGINGYNGSLCNNCRDTDVATSKSYRVSGASGASTLKPPLYYAAKYGNDYGTDAYFEVNNINQLAASLRNVLGGVLMSSNQTGSGLGYSANYDGMVFQTVYNNLNSWSGDLIAYNISSAGIGSRRWSARERLITNGSDRLVITTNPQTQQGVSFSADVLTGDVNGAASIVSYLRGSAENEIDGEGGGQFRKRVWLDNSPAPLGDIIDSRPFVVATPDSYYVPTSAQDTSYLDFVNSYKNRTPMVYVGANDGMLHGFNAETGDEEIAYVPGLLLDPVVELADPSYEHRFYVDGSPTVLDARWSGQWHSVLASGLGSGGRGIFALDVTNPDGFNEDIADQLALFEYGPNTEQALFGGDKWRRDDGEGEDDHEDSSGTNELHLGYIYGRPSIVQLEDERYAVVFGNGYFSLSGKAALYIIYLDKASDGRIDASDVIRLVPSSSANAGENGLSTVSMIDRDKNGKMDTAYAGDLLGNLWRFDLSGDPSSWQDSITHLFTAKQGNAYPLITTSVDVGSHPDGGLMVFFGTGSRPGRSLPTSQSRGAVDGFYAFRDNDSQGQANYPLTRSNLAERTLATQERLDEEGNSVTLRYFMDPPSDNMYAANGWFMDFPDNERVIDAPILYGDRIIFTSLIPGQGMCGAEDSGFLYELSAFKGLALDSPANDANGDGLINGQDKIIDSGGGDGMVPVGIGTQGAIYTPVIDTNLEDNTENKLTVNTGAQTQSYRGTPLNPLELGRVSWRELGN